MAIRKIVTTKDAGLREKSRPVGGVDKKLLQLVKDLEDTLSAQNDPEGVGLAAPQIGVNLRVFIMRYRGKIVPIINPEIISMSEKTNEPEEQQTINNKEPAFAKASAGKQNDYIMEGCLSLPYYYGPVKRTWEVTLKYQVLKERGTRHPSTSLGTSWALGTRIKTFKDFSAKIIQHEVDHLDGKIFVDRLLEQKRKLYEMKGKRWEEVEI